MASIPKSVWFVICSRQMIRYADQKVLFLCCSLLFIYFDLIRLILYSWLFSYQNIIKIQCNQKDKDSRIKMTRIICNFLAHYHFKKSKMFHQSFIIRSQTYCIPFKLMLKYSNNKHLSHSCCEISLYLISFFLSHLINLYLVLEFISYVRDFHVYGFLFIFIIFILLTSLSYEIVYFLLLGFGSFINYMPLNVSSFV